MVQNADEPRPGSRAHNPWAQNLWLVSLAFFRDVGSECILRRDGLDVLFQDATRSAVASTSCRCTGNVLHGGCGAYRFTRLSDRWSSSLRRAINTNGTGSSSAGTFPEGCGRKYRE